MLKMCQNDGIFLEDESGRIKLVGPHTNATEMVTGIPCAVRGRVLAGGEFEVPPLA
jgi:hypothetical protein